MISHEHRATMMIVHDMQALPERTQFITWPPHVIVVPWFLVPTPRWPEAGRLVEDAAHQFAPIPVGIGDIAMYGGRRQRPATKITDPTGQLHALHTFIRSRLSDMGCPIEGPVRDPEDYSPHMTHKPKFDLPADDFHIDKLTLVTRKLHTNLDKYILRVCDLGGSN
jgi:hypothetical protein